MIKRLLGDKIRRLFQQFPVVTVTGPRQSGKTTLCRSVFPDMPYVSLETPDDRDFARDDPRGFLARFPKGGIIDEVQRVPQLTSYLQTLVDETGKEGMFILTGSQSFELMRSLGQSLAGRTAVLKLLPFSLAELTGSYAPRTYAEAIYKGFYPRIYDKKLDPLDAYSAYVSTYLERDLRNLLKVHNLGLFETFLRLCAGRSGQILNLSSLGSDCGISHNTAREWLDLLETSFIVKRLPPWSRNLNKRLVKSPKLYFLDPGLACHLLGMNSFRQVETHPLRGALFETLVYSELLKKRYNDGLPDNMCFFRDSNGNEVDFIVEDGTGFRCYEAKSSATVNPDFFTGLRRFSELAKIKTTSFLVYAGKEAVTRESIRITPWNAI